MATICLYQDSRHAAPLLWVRRTLGCGYVSKRSDGITELRINGFSQVRETLESLLPYLRFKKKQAQLLIRACTKLEAQTLRTMKANELCSIVQLLLRVQQENYASTKRKTKADLYQELGLTP